MDIPNKQGQKEQRKQKGAGEVAAGAMAVAACTACCLPVIGPVIGPIAGPVLAWLGVAALALVQPYVLALALLVVAGVIGLSLLARRRRRKAGATCTLDRDAACS